MLFQWVSFMIVDLIIESKIIIVKNDLFLTIAKFNIGIVLPILLDVAYKNLKVKLKISTNSLLSTKNGQD